jgi:hypothetical protein
MSAPTRCLPDGQRVREARSGSRGIGAALATAVQQ